MFITTFFLVSRCFDQIKITMVATVFLVFTMTQALPSAPLLHNGLRWALVAPFAAGIYLCLKSLSIVSKETGFESLPVWPPAQIVTSCINQHVAASQGQSTSVHGWLWSGPEGGWGGWGGHRTDHRPIVKCPRSLSHPGLASPLASGPLPHNGSGFQASLSQVFLILIFDLSLWKERFERISMVFQESRDEGESWAPGSLKSRTPVLLILKVNGLDFLLGSAGTPRAFPPLSPGRWVECRLAKVLLGPVMFWRQVGSGAHLPTQLWHRYTVPRPALSPKTRLLRPDPNRHSHDGWSPFLPAHGARVKSARAACSTVIMKNKIVWNHK